jgi:acyl-CoA synthetase (AMP-forming)/AMP-acid ligase II
MSNTSLDIGLRPSNSRGSRLNPILQFGESPLLAFTSLGEMSYILFARIEGMRYQDVLHVFGVSRAGYIPVLLHFHRSSSKSLIVELLRRAKTLALICDVSLTQLNRDTLQIPVHPNSDLRRVGVPSQSRLPRVEDLVSDPNAVAFVMHTAGTTMGSPKLVPYTHRTIDSIMRSAQLIAAPASSRRQDTYVLK